MRTPLTSFNRYNQRIIPLYIAMSESTSSTSFTLSFGGIEFCLEPNINGDNKINDNDNSIMNMNVTKIDNGEVLINLNNYFGTLRVKNTALSTGLKANDDINDDENMSIDTNNNLGLGAPKVTDTPSPPMKSCEGNEENKVADEETKDQKGQQKLNFFGKPGKKVNSKKSEVCTYYDMSFFLVHHDMSFYHYKYMRR